MALLPDLAEAVSDAKFCRGCLLRAASPSRPDKLESAHLVQCLEVAIDS